MGIPLAAIVTVLLGRFVGVKELCALRDDELNAVILLFFGLNFIGAIVRNLEVIAFWISLMRKLSFIDFII